VENSARLFFYVVSAILADVETGFQPGGTIAFAMGHITLGTKKRSVAGQFHAAGGHILRQAGGPPLPIQWSRRFAISKNYN